MAYEVIIKAPAQRDLDSLPEKEVIRIARRLAQLQQNPRPVGVQKLTDQEGTAFASEIIAFSTSLMIKKDKYRFIVSNTARMPIVD